jgi:hypothetical protein
LVFVGFHQNSTVRSPVPNANEEETVVVSRNLDEFAEPKSKLPGSPSAAVAFGADEIDML